MALKYKVGDRVKIKSLDWYNENKDTDGFVHCHPYTFVAIMSQYCGTIFTINSIDNFDKKYKMTEDGYHFDWTDEMIEGLVEEEMKSEDELLGEYEEFTDRAFKGGYEKCKSDIELNGFHLPDGYIFKDENGNVINAKKIVLEKKKKEYPKTYEECCKVMNYCCNPAAVKTTHREELIRRFQILLLYRDAYWKIAGEEMGLGKPWKPDWKNEKGWIHCITNDCGEICCTGFRGGNKILAFPTEEMRDAFKQNFDQDIEFCKELL